MKTKTIDMQKLMEGLNIKTGDIVCVNGQYLICNKDFDLIKLDGCYNAAIPNLIVGMVSGKYDYSVYSLKHEIISKNDKNAAKVLKKYNNCKPIAF